MTRTAFPIAALASIAAWAAIAPMASAATPAANTEIVSVRAGDLNLNTQAGAREVLKRVDEAATRMCWPDKLDTFAEFGACRATVILDAVTTLNKPMVSLVYAETYPSNAKPITVASR